MRFRKLDLNLLVTLNVLMTERSVTRAAERLRLTQPAVSNALAKLRRHFKDDLIAPAGRNMVLTPFALSLREPLCEFLRLAHVVVDAAPAFDPSSSERCFTLVASDVVMTVLIPPVVRRLASEAPGVSLDILEPQGNRLLEDIENGEVDLLIIPQEYASDQFPRETLYEDSYSCVVWQESRAVGETLSLEQYRCLRHVSMNFGRAQHSGLIGAVNERAGLMPVSAIQLPFFSLGPEVIVGTDYLMVLPTQLALHCAISLPLRVLPPPLPFPPIFEVMQWRDHEGMDPGVDWLRSVLRSEAEAKCNPSAALAI